jgi:hypothetical protein
MLESKRIGEHSSPATKTERASGSGSINTLYVPMQLGSIGLHADVLLELINP